MFFAAQRDQANITTGSFIRFYPHRGPHEQEADPASLTARGATPGVSWDFSKIPIFASNRADRLQTPLADLAPRLFSPIQAKLKVGAVDDPLEHEADRVADQIMLTPAPGVSTTIRRLRSAASAPRARRRSGFRKGRTGHSPPMPRPRRSCIGHCARRESHSMLEAVTSSRRASLMTSVRCGSITARLPSNRPVRSALMPSRSAAISCLEEANMRLRRSRR